MVGKKDLASLLDSLPGFERPKLRLEQYITPGEIAATVAWAMYMRGELAEGWIADLGCGTGRLAYAVAALGGRAICIDIDVDALRTAEVLGLDVALCDAERPCAKRPVKVVMNPPFGVWTRHGDVRFLRGAASIAEIIYSIHKAAAVEHVFRVARSLGLEPQLLETAAVYIPPMYRHHRKRRHRVEVAILRLESTSRGTRGR